MSLCPEHLADLEKSGLNEETIQRAKIFSVPPADISKILGKFYADRVNSLLAFPYRNGFYRYKLFPPIKDKDGHKIKYYQPPGSGVHLYFPPGIEEILNDPSLPLSFTEGEKKALKAFQEGIFCLGLGGIWNFGNGENGLAEDFDRIPLEGREVNIIPDGDYHRNQDIQNAVLRFAEALKKRGAKPHLILLPEEEPRLGLDDFLVKFGVRAFWELPREEILTDPFERLRLPTALEIANLDTKVEWVVAGLIPKNSITLLHSIGGVGKTYLMLTLGYAVAEGTRFFGFDTQRLPTFYIDFENPISEISERIKKIGSSEQMWIWHLGHNPPPIRLDSDEWEVYKKFPPGLFIIDSLRSSHFLEENSSREASLLMARFKAIRALGNTIVLIHHETKLGNYRGSTAWFDLADHILKFSRVRGVGSDQETEEDDFNLPLRLGLGGKSRFSSAIATQPLYLRFKEGQLCLAQDPDTEALLKIRDLIGEGIFYNQLYKLAMEDEDLGGLGKSRFERLINKGAFANPPLWKKDQILERGRPRTFLTKMRADQWN